jgi:hypothetical protein
MNNLPTDISNRIMRFVSHPVADLLNHEIKINNEYIQELIDFGHSFSSAYFQIYSEIKQLEELRGGNI